MRWSWCRRRDRLVSREIKSRRATNRAIGLECSTALDMMAAPMALSCPACAFAIDPESFDDEGRVACGGCAAPLAWDGVLRVASAATPVRTSTLVLLDPAPAPRWSEADLPSLDGPSAPQPSTDRWLYAVLAVATCALVAVVTVHLVLRAPVAPPPASAGR
jgi:hypothetical protein